MQSCTERIEQIPISDIKARANNLYKIACKQGLKAEEKIEIALKNVSGLFNSMKQRNQVIAKRNAMLPFSAIFVSAPGENTWKRYKYFLFFEIISL